MGIEGRLNKIEKAVQADVVSFELNDGHKYRHSSEGGRELSRHAANCARADYQRKPRPPAPEVFYALANAKNRSRAVEQLYPDWSHKRPFCPYNLEVLVRDGEIVDEKFAPSYEPVLAVGEEG